MLPSDKALLVRVSYRAHLQGTGQATTTYLFAVVCRTERHVPRGRYDRGYRGSRTPLSPWLAALKADLSCDAIIVPEAADLFCCRAS